MIGKKPVTLPRREWFSYAGQTVTELPVGLLKRRNAFAQTSVSAIKDALTCRRQAFFKSTIGMTTAQHPKAAAGDVLHKQTEGYYKHGVIPTHPSVQRAITEKLLPERSELVRSEEEFWLPTGVETAASPDGQLWLKGYMDLMYPDGASIVITDLKTKDDPEKIEKYSLKKDDLLTDEQMGVYGHVFHANRSTLAETLCGPVDLKVGHLNLSRSASQPYAKLVQIDLPPNRTRSTYLKLLDTAEVMVKDATCGDWQAVPGNFAKCEKPFVCPFIPLCHGRSADMFDIPALPDEQGTKPPCGDDVNPYADKAPEITPPDAAPAGVWAVPQKEPKKAKGEKKVTELDELLNTAKGLGFAPPVIAAPVVPQTHVATPSIPPAPAVNQQVTKSTATQGSTPLKTQPGREEGSTDAADLDALLSMSSIIPKTVSSPPAVATAVTSATDINKPPPPQPAYVNVAAVSSPVAAVSSPVAAVSSPAVLTPVVAAVPPPATVVASPVAPVVAAKAAPVITPAPAVAVQGTSAPAVAPSPVGIQASTWSVDTLCVGCMPEGTPYTSLADLIHRADRALCEAHNKRLPASPIGSMYQLSHGEWRGHFSAILPPLVKELRDKMVKDKTPHPLVIVAMGDSPAMTTAVECLAGLSRHKFWSVR